MTYFIFGSIRPDMLVQDLKKPCEVMGYISKEVAEITGLPEGLPVIASGADKACETLAVGCDGPDVAAISMGTAASIEITTEKYVEPQPFLPAYPSIYQDKYNPEVLIFRGYWMISWFKNEFAHKELVEASERGVIPENCWTNICATSPRVRTDLSCNLSGRRARQIPRRRARSSVLQITTRACTFIALLSKASDLRCTTRLNRWKNARATILNALWCRAAARIRKKCARLPPTCSVAKCKNSDVRNFRIGRCDGIVYRGRGI